MSARIEIVRVEGNVVSIEAPDLPVYSNERDGTFTVFSPNLKIIGYSKESLESAIDDFKEALNVFFDIHVEDDTIDEVLENFNFIKQNQHKHVAAPPAFSNNVLKKVEYAY